MELSGFGGWLWVGKLREIKSVVLVPTRARIYFFCLSEFRTNTGRVIFESTHVFLIVCTGPEKKWLSFTANGH